MTQNSKVQSANNGGIKGILPLIIIVLVFLFLMRGTILAPNFDSPMSEFVFSRAKSIPTEERDVVASYFLQTANEIDKLVDPLYTPGYPLRYPEDAVHRIHSLIYTGVSSPEGWNSLLKSISEYVERYDSLYRDAGFPNRTIYGVGEQFKLIAEGLSPSLIEQFADNEELLFEDTVGHDEPIDIQRYYESGMGGVFIDEPGQPEYAREMARKDEESFDVVLSSMDFDAFPIMNEQGRGRRAVYHNYAFRFRDDAYTIGQITGNCVFASSGDSIMTHLIGVNIFLYGSPIQFESISGSALYAFRGHSGAGSTLPRAAATHLRWGYVLRKDYGEGFDLRDSRTDQRVGINHWRNPEQSLRHILEQMRETPAGKIKRLENITQDNVLDALYVGAAIHVSGRVHGATGGDPISPGLSSIGPHAMALLSYDDTDEFRQWYRQKTGKTLTGPAMIFLNTWSDHPRYVARNWPEHLWGKRPAGAFVLTWRHATTLLSGSSYIYYPQGLRGKIPSEIDYRIRLSSFRAGE